MRQRESVAFCDIVPAAGGRVLLVPWGKVETENGAAFEFNEESGRRVVEAFNSRGIDLVIDYEHVSEGGQFARADKLAPAMGWVKGMEAVPGEGLYGQVEWTPEGHRLIQSKAYRYLSPVVLYRETDGVVTRLRSAALVNQPAIPRMPALVNKEEVPEPQEKPMEPLLQYLRERLGLPAEATPEDILAKLKEADTASATEVAANKLLNDSLVAVAGELGEAGKPLAEALKAGKPEAVASGLRTALNRVQNDPAKVDKAQLDALRAEVDSLRSRQVESECDQLIAANSAKLPPAKHDWFRKTFKADPQFAREWIKEAPELVSTSPSTGTSGAAPDRAMAINSARAKFREGAGWGGRTEREFVSGQLLAAGQAAIKDDEAVKLGF